MADNLIDDIKIVLSADDKAAKGPIDDLLSRLDGIGKSAESNGNATKEFFDRIAKGGEEAAKSMGKLADAAGKSGKGIKGATKGFSEIADYAERVVPAAEDAKKALDGIDGAGDKIAPFGGGEKYLTFLDSLADKAMQAGSILKTKLADGARAAGKALAKLSISPITMPLKVASSAIKKMTGAVSGLFRQIKRVAMYRAIRSAIRMITDGFREGTQNAYQWSKAMGGTFAASMDTLATSSLYLKNSLGALATPIINAVAPAIDWLIDKFVTLLNVVNQVIALLTGAKTWTKAIKYPKEYAAATNDAAGGAGKLAKAMTTILAIDELNPLNADKGGGGGGGGGGAGALDYSQMFEEQALAVSSTLESMFDPFKKAWDKKGAKVVKSIKNAISGVKSLVDAVGDSFWEVWTNGTGQKTVEHILGIFTGINDTIGNIARQLATGWRTDNLGTKIIQNLWNSLNDILGLWERITTSTANWAKGVDFTPLMGAIERVTKAIEPLVKIITDGLGWAWENILLPFGSWAIEDAIPATLDIIATAIDGISKVAEAAAPYLKAIWDDFLSPLAEFAGEAVVEVLGGINWLVEKLFELVQKAIPIVGKFATAFKQLISGDLEGAISTLKSLAPQQGSTTHNSASGMEFGGNSGTIGKVNLVANITDVITKNLPADKKNIPAVANFTNSSATSLTAKMKTIGTVAKYESADPNSLSKADKTISATADFIASTVASIPGYDANKKKVSFPSYANFNGWGYTGISGYSSSSQRILFPSYANFGAWSYSGLSGYHSSNSRLWFPSYAVFEDYETTFKKVKMALQITDAYKPNGQRISLEASGGAFFGGKWHDIAQFATGGVPSHGSLYIAGEAGSELVGHIGGRTEVLNQSQIASTIAAATQMSNASQNNILLQLLNGVEQLVEGQGDVRAYIPAGEVVSGLQRNNRRDGRALVPMGV